VNWCCCAHLTTPLSDRGLNNPILAPDLLVLVGGVQIGLFGPSTLTLGVGKHVGAGGIDADGEAFVFQMMTDEAGNVGIVFDDEKAWFHGIIVNAKRLSVASCQLSGAGAGMNFIGL